jgi:hypothetical protein
MSDYAPYLRFAWVDNRYDEFLTEAFEMRFTPSLYVIDDTFNGVDNGTVYQWDTYEWPEIDTFGTWIVNKTYKNSSISFPTPRLVY